MSSPASPSLLGIPVEVRDQIFDYVLSPATPTLLGIPVEVRDEILEYVLAAELCSTNEAFVAPSTRAVFFLPNVMHINQQIRDELLDLYFRKKTIWFWTFGELGATMVNQPAIARYWRSVHVRWTGRRTIDIEGDRWRLEPRLQLATHIPKLTRLHLEVDTIRCIGDTNIDTEIHAIVQQITTTSEIQDHPTLHTLRVSGILAEPRTTPSCYTMVSYADFSAVYTRRPGGEWTLKQMSIEPWLPTTRSEV